MPSQPAIARADVVIAGGGSAGRRIAADRHVIQSPADVSPCSRYSKSLVTRTIDQRLSCSADPSLILRNEPKASVLCRRDGELHGPQPLGAQSSPARRVVVLLLVQPDPRSLVRITAAAPAAMPGPKLRSANAARDSERAFDRSCRGRNVGTLARLCRDQ